MMHNGTTTRNDVVAQMCAINSNSCSNNGDL